MKDCYRWDFTLKFGENNADELILIDLIRKKTKKYAFQLEKSETKACSDLQDGHMEGGYVHYQGRISLVKKKTLSALIKFFFEPQFNAIHFSPTSTNAKDDNLYVMKEDTRIKGPWTDQDEIVYIPRQIREMDGLRPFQQHIVNNASVWNTRSINMVYCKKGNIGKSLLVGYCRAHKVGRALPPVNDTKDLLRMVCDLPTSTMYLFDMPRSMNKERLFGFFSAVETIKDGYAYDDRYNFKEKVFDCPNIWIFSNSLPDENMLSKDRWIIWEIDEKYELKKYYDEEFIM